MAAPEASVPVLPGEMLEEIVDSLAQLDEHDIVAINWRYVGRKGSPSMLALSASSRQLRRCAIRHLYRHIDVYCGRPMDKLHRLIEPDNPADLPLGGIAPNIKSLRICIRVKDWRDRHPITEDSIIELFHGPLLASIGNRSPLSTLGIEQSGSYNLPTWDDLPDEFRRTLLSLLQIPSLRSLKLVDLYGMPAEALRCVPLQMLSLRFYERVRFNGQATDVPAVPNHHITSLYIRESDIPEGLSFPNLRHLSTSCKWPGHLHKFWAIITSLGKNLTSLEFKDCDPMVVDVYGNTLGTPTPSRFGLLPLLEDFTYRLTMEGEPPALLPQATFYQVLHDAPALKRVDIKIRIKRAADTQEEMISRIITDPGWDSLDRFLDESYFPHLARVRITLKQSVAVHARPNGDSLSDDIKAVRDLHVEAESALQQYFARLKQKASVHLELHCPIGPWSTWKIKDSPL